MEIKIGFASHTNEWMLIDYPKNLIIWKLLIPL